MLVLKFGGTSVGKPERMKKIGDLVLSTPGPKIVVLSALSGTTNALISIGDYLIAKNLEAAEEEILKLEVHYQSFIKILYSTESFQVHAKKIVSRYFTFIRLLAEGDPDSFTNDGKSYRELLAQGELISTELFYQHLQESKVKSHLLPALDFMSIDENQEPELEKIAQRLLPLLNLISNAEVIITQGFICRNHQNEIDNLKRGGSDYTASLIGSALRVEEIQIWTDIDGMHNNDPRIVKKTFPIAELTFDEASELAYFGAKILHPSTIVPAQKYNVPVRLKNTMDEGASGTLISGKGNEGSFKAVAAKDGITAIKIKSSRMLMAYGFLRKVFEVFEYYKTPIDMICTSEIAVSLTIDNNRNLNAILKDIASFGTVEVDADQSIICVVGQHIGKHEGVLKKVFVSLEKIPVRMVSVGGSSNNISVLVDTSVKNQALIALNEGLFGLSNDTSD